MWKLQQQTQSEKIEVLSKYSYIPNNILYIYVLEAIHDKVDTLIKALNLFARLGEL